MRTTDICPLERRPSTMLPKNNLMFQQKVAFLMVCLGRSGQGVYTFLDGSKYEVRKLFLWLSLLLLSTDFKFF